MTSLRSVIITVPKGMQKGEMAAPLNDYSSSKNWDMATIIPTKIKKEDRIEEKLQIQITNDLSRLPDKSEPWLRGKKRRLDHLTWEEKMQRKKMKNRVAAQTSRDRKKAKLDELEDTVAELRKENQFFARECALLRAQNETLIAEAKRLKEKNEDKSTDNRLCTSCQSRVGCAAPALGSAESPIDPLPQGGATQLAPSPVQTSNAEILLKMLTLYLLWTSSSATCKVTGTLRDSRSLQKVFCAKLPLKWKLALRDHVRKWPWNKIPLRNLKMQKWWGRHQKMWKPVPLVKV